MESPCSLVTPWPQMIVNNQPPPGWTLGRNFCRASLQPALLHTSHFLFLFFVFLPKTYQFLNTWIMQANIIMWNRGKKKKIYIYTSTLVLFILELRTMSCSFVFEFQFMSFLWVCTSKLATPYPRPYVCLGCTERCVKHLFYSSSVTVYSSVYFKKTKTKKKWFNACHF